MRPATDLVTIAQLYDGLRAGKSVYAAAKSAGMRPAAAYPYARAWRNQPAPPPEHARGLRRRCPQCQQITPVDPCRHCGVEIAPRARGGQ